mgnify:FL=1
MIKVTRKTTIIPDGKYELIVELEREVNPETTIIVPCGSINDGSNGSSTDYPGDWDARLELLDNKHLLIKRGWNYWSAEVSWQLVEVLP